MSSGKIRILIVSPVPPAVGGISVSSSRLKDRLVLDGYEVDTYNMQKASIPVGYTVWQFFYILFLPVYILFSKKFDIIHINISSYWRRIYLKLVYKCFKSAKIVVTHHSDVASYINKPFSRHILDVGDKIICVRAGNRALFPEKMQPKIHEIPAFIMPPARDMDDANLPPDILSFLKDAEKNGTPILAFNGLLVFSDNYYDLYGFMDFSKMLVKFKDQGIKVAAIMIVNDLYLDKEKQDFIKKVDDVVKDLDNVRFLRNRHFPFIPILKKSKVIYVRPTKTDGDSLCVREAIALNVPVVTTNAAPRPEEAICYDIRGGIEALCKTVKNVIDNDKYICDGADSKDYYEDIVSVYNSLLDRT